ncbi:MAG: GntR family transcriptional regulator [Desulfobacterales bacterium]|nr:GntR family transcriptional regulator [Desulfobacterales bacterium]
MAPKSKEKSSHLSAAQQVAEQHIRDSIIRGSLAPGAHLKESRLAEELGVSRFHVREALRFLQADGLVESVPYKGNFVRRFSQRDVVELFSVRGGLEEVAVRQMIPRLTDDMVEAFKETVVEMERLEKAGDLTGSAEMDLQFHRLICEFSGNRRLLEMWESLAHHVKLFLFMEKSGYGVDTAYVLTHLDLIDAMEQRDVALAEAHVRIHLNGGMKYLLENIFMD